jgi:hypothetical protein
MNNQPAGSGTSLAGRSKGSEKNTLNGQINFRIIHDDERILATQFEGDSL